MCGLNCHLLSCKFSGVPRSLPQWSAGPLAFTHRHGQSDGVHWPHLLCIRGRKTLSMVSNANPRPILLLSTFLEPENFEAMQEEIRICS